MRYCSEFSEKFAKVCLSSISSVRYFTVEALNNTVTLLLHRYTAKTQQNDTLNLITMN